MKIEIGESLACSYLRHVERCWLVQANWKAPEHWGRRRTDAELEALFEQMKSRFDRAVFKKTKNAAQFLKQGEIDVVGVDQQGGVHAMEVAFHEAGLNYGSKAETVNRVLKKMLRTLLILRACHPPQTPLYIYFLSPKVNPAVQRPLEEKFAALRKAYPDVDWRLLTNDDFVNRIVKPTLDNASDVAEGAKALHLTGSAIRVVSTDAGIDDEYSAARHSTAEGVAGQGERFPPAQAWRGAWGACAPLMGEFPLTRSGAPTRR